MVKKVRFPLEMENEVQVRTMEELREKFSLPKVLSYLKEGKLVVWLRDRYVNDIADAVENLDIQDEELAKKLCEIFEVSYDETTEEELEKAAERAERVRRLREYTDDKQYEKEIDNVAFDQDELYDLLDEDVDTIYLCGERFSIPLAKSGVTYIGINNPVAVIDSKIEVDWVERGITLEQVTYDDKYKEIVEEVNLPENEKKKRIMHRLIKKLQLMNDTEMRNLLEESFPYTVPEMNCVHEIVDQFAKGVPEYERIAEVFFPFERDMIIEGKNMELIARFIEFFHAESYETPEYTVYKKRENESWESRKYADAMVVYVVYKTIVAIQKKDVSSCRDAVTMLDIIVDETLEKNKEEVNRRIHDIETLVNGVNTQLEYSQPIKQNVPRGMDVLFNPAHYLAGIGNGVEKRELFDWAKNLNASSK